MRNWFKQITPDPEVLLASRWLRPVAHRLNLPAICHFNRRNVARGVALGLFVGFVLPIGQILVAALLAASARGNMLVAAVATLITNPFTFPPIYYAAYRTGSLILGTSAGSPQSVGDGGKVSAAAILEMLTSASFPTLVGLVLFAVISAAVGFLLVHLGWRLSLLWQWRKRTQASRTDENPRKET